MSPVNVDWISIVLSDHIIWWSEEMVCSMEIHYIIAEVIEITYLHLVTTWASGLSHSVNLVTEVLQEYVCIDVAYILFVSKLHLVMSIFPIVIEKAIPPPPPPYIHVTVHHKKPTDKLIPQI